MAAADSSATKLVSNVYFPKTREVVSGFRADEP